jgi:hypothetical protein
MEPSRRGKNSVFRAHPARFISRRPRISSAFRSRVFSQFVNSFSDSLPTFEVLLDAPEKPRIDILADVLGVHRHQHDGKLVGLKDSPTKRAATAAQ